MSNTLLGPRNMAAKAPLVALMFEWGKQQESK